MDTVTFIDPSRKGVTKDVRDEAVAGDPYLPPVLNIQTIGMVRMTVMPNGVLMGKQQAPIAARSVAVGASALPPRHVTSPIGVVRLLP